jgi:cell division protein FtsB|tara:strand:+ start:3532 stop:3849 length:318 start_codon:yes stop_codon:yes gene_type:complete
MIDVLKKILLSVYRFSLVVLKNRYAATFVIALTWIMFVSDIDLFFILREQKDLNRIHRDVAALTIKNLELEGQLIDVDDLSTLERIAREKYYMKKPNEEVYRIVD